MANHTHIISKDSPAYQPCRLPPHATRAPLVGGNIYVLVGLEKIPVSAQGKGKEALRSHSLVARRLMYFSSTVPLERHLPAWPSLLAYLCLVLRCLSPLVSVSLLLSE